MLNFQCFEEASHNCEYVIDNWEGKAQSVADDEIYFAFVMVEGIVGIFYLK